MARRNGYSRVGQDAYMPVAGHTPTVSSFSKVDIMTSLMYLLSNAF